MGLEQVELVLDVEQAFGVKIGGEDGYGQQAGTVGEFYDVVLRHVHQLPRPPSDAVVWQQVVAFKDVDWPTTEHYFQAQKFAGTPREEEIRLVKSPGKAASMGRDRSFALRPDWESVKDDVMREAVLAKFKQHPILASLLLATGDAQIVEHTVNDSYWGDGGDGSGKNMLGRILVEVRGQLRGG